MCIRDRHIAGGGSVRDVVSLFREGNMKMLFAGQKISDEDQADLEAVFVDSGETESLSGDVDDVAEKSGICADVYEDALKSPEDVVVRFQMCIRDRSFICRESLCRHCSLIR